MKSTILLPPTAQFWAQCARRVIGLYPDAASPDFSALRIIVPAFAHAKLLTQAMSNELNGAFIPPRINTMSGWLALQTPVPNTPKAISDSERLMTLYAQLREHGWLKKLFSARKNTDLLPLAQTLITLSDELTEANLPSVMAQDTEQTEQIWHQALTQLPLPAQQVVSDEAQLIWQIWMSQIDGRDPISVRCQQMQRLTECAVDPLVWISPVEPTALEREFLSAYAKRNPVHFISLDWDASVFGSAWNELAEQQTPTDLLNVEHVSTIATDSLEHEAQRAAQTILNWLQQGKSSIAIVAQDRVVARRIRALLERAQVVVADETGWKLSTTRAAAALAAWFDVVATRADTVLLLDLLKSPYFAPDDMEWDEKSSLVMQIELALLRANVIGGWEALLYALKMADVPTALIEQLKKAAIRYSERKTLVGWLELTSQTLEQFGMLQRWQQDAAGQQVAQLLDTLRESCADVSESFSFSEWRVLMNMQLESTAFQDKSNDFRVVMLPLNGARLRRFDAVLVAGCDAAHLPSQPKEVLFFTNAVRRECGLVTREQRQRQQLRDFAELLSVNPEVVLTWQRQQCGENNPVSPWIERLNLYLQRTGCAPLAERDAPLVTISLPVIMTEQPRPTAQPLKPSTLSASGFNSFLACPYQFFAMRMLGLSPLDALSDMPEKRDYGGWLHGILKKYHDTLKAQSADYPPEKHEALLREISDAMFATVVQKSPAALGYRIRWQKAIPAYVAWSQAHAQAGWQFEMGEVWLEKQLRWEDGSITLRGQIDRIDKNAEGELAVLDYKTTAIGALTKKLKEAEDHQLPFYGLLAEQETAPITSAHYVALEMTKEKIDDIAATDYADRQHALKQSIIQTMSAIGNGAALPAQGISQVCHYCEMRGLCRKGAW